MLLPYDVERGTILLARQFRYPVYVNDHPDGLLIEAAAGLLDADDPVTAIRRESAEELGISLTHVDHVFDAYMSPESVTERLHFFAAAYSPASRAGDGGGLRRRARDDPGRPDHGRQDRHAPAAGRPRRTLRQG